MRRGVWSRASSPTAALHLRLRYPVSRTTDAHGRSPWSGEACYKAGAEADDHHLCSHWSHDAQVYDTGTLPQLSKGVSLHIGGSQQNMRETTHTHTHGLADSLSPRGGQATSPPHGRRDEPLRSLWRPFISEAATGKNLRGRAEVLKFYTQPNYCLTLRAKERYLQPCALCGNSNITQRNVPPTPKMKENSPSI